MERRPAQLFTKWAVGEAVIAELLDYFSDARVTGIRVREREALTIAVGVLSRLSQDYPAELERVETETHSPSRPVSDPKS